MDDIVIKTKKRTAYNYWKKNGTPNGGNYDTIIVNRYWFKDYFSIELKTDYMRIYNVFLDTLSI